MYVSRILMIITLFPSTVQRGIIQNLSFWDHILTSLSLDHMTSSKMLTALLLIATPAGRMRLQPHTHVHTGRKKSF